MAKQFVDKEFPMCLPCSTLGCAGSVRESGFVLYIAVLALENFEAVPVHHYLFECIMYDNVTVNDKVSLLCQFRFRTHLFFLDVIMY